MKYTSILSMALLLALSVSFVAAATVPSLTSLSGGQVSDSGTSYKVTLLKTEPLPAKPGNTLEAWIQVSNTGDQSGSGLHLLIDDSYPFSPVSANDADINVGNLPGHTDYVVKVTLLVDPAAADGTFDLDVSLSLGNGASSRFSLPIEVDSGASALTVASAETTPAEVIPGDKSTLVIVLQNLEASELQDVNVKLDLDSSVFAPVGGSNQQKVSRLSGGDSRTFSFDFVTEPDAISNVYRIPVTVTATTKSGEAITQQETVGIVVRALPELSVVVDSADVTIGSSDGSVLLRLVNKGLSQIKFAQVELLPGDGYTLTGNNAVQYVGNIDSDDFETVDYALKSSVNSFTLNVHVTYKDALNNAYEETVKVPITAQAAQKSGNGLWIIIVIVVVAIVGIVLWRRSRSKSTKR